MNYHNDVFPCICNNDYERHFWNAMRGNNESMEHLTHGKETATGSYILANTGSFNKALKNESLFRRIGTVVNAYGTDYRIFAKDCKDLAAWIPEGGEIPMQSVLNDFAAYTVGSHKLAVFLKTDEAFVRDSSFDFEDYLTSRLAQNFGRTEENAFINGIGDGMPTGIICPEKGAEVAATISALTYEDVVKLFFSVKPEYRRRGTWLMNDETALVLRTLKDPNDNYLWNHANDTILGKRVIISEYMPSIGDGAMPIVFGDFRYYWVICRKPLSVRPLKEKYVLLGQIGHLAYEFLDGKLIRREAIKGLKMAETENPEEEPETESVA